MEITTKGKRYPTKLPINQAGNLPPASFVQAENLNTISRHGMTEFSGTFGIATMRKVPQRLMLTLRLQRGGGTD